jgi:hypothetical protein
MTALAEFCNPERLVSAIPCLAAALTETMGGGPAAASTSVMGAIAAWGGVSVGTEVVSTAETLRTSLAARGRLRAAVAALFKPVMVRTMLSCCCAAPLPVGADTRAFVCVCVCVCVCRSFVHSSEMASVCSTTVTAATVRT